MPIKYRSVVEGVLIFIIAIALVYAVSYFVPFSMDEFYQYHTIASIFYPLNVMNVFLERPSQYDLAPCMDIYLPLRSFHYTGSITSLIYYPLFLIWRSPYSARFLGLIMLAIQAVMIYKIFNIRPIRAFLGLVLFMPYAFQHIVDTGPVSFQTTSVFLLYYLLIIWFNDLKNGVNRYLIPSLAGVLIFLNIWVKLTYFFMLPAICLLMLAFFIRENAVITKDTAVFRRFLKHLSCLILSASIPAWALLNSTDRTYHKYADQLLRSDGSAPMSAFSYIKHILDMISFSMNPMKTAHRIFNITEFATVKGLLLAAAAVLFFFAAFRIMRKKKIDRSFAAINLCLFAFTYVFFTFHVKTWAMHHIVLCYPFLIMAACYSISLINWNKLLASAFVLFLSVNLWLYASVAFMKPMPSEHPSKIKMNEFLANHKLASKYVYVIVDWGFYYIQALYGDKDQCVVYINPFNRTDNVNMLRMVLAEVNRKSLFILRLESESDLDLIKASFPDLVDMPMGFDTGDWRIWYEK